MIHIAICDDETKIGAELEDALAEIFGKLNITYDIDVFFCCGEFYKKIETGTHYDLIFLDIEFVQGNATGAGRSPNGELLAHATGIEVGRLIRDTLQNHLSSIVYISWEKKYALQLFDIQPLNFIVKPLRHEKIEEIVRKYLKIAGLWSGEFTYKIGHDTFKAQVKDIVYLESYDRKLVLHLAGGKQEEFYGSIKEAYEQLKRFDFLFIHKSYVVNYDYITALKFNQVSLIGSQMPIPISKHRQTEVRERYYEIMKRRMM